MCFKAKEAVSLFMIQPLFYFSQIHCHAWTFQFFINLPLEFLHLLSLYFPKKSFAICSVCPCWEKYIKTCDFKGGIVEPKPRCLSRFS